MSDPRFIHAHAHAMLVEQIMALIGRASSDPKRYRQILESYDIATLRRLWNELTENLTACPATKPGHPATDGESGNASRNSEEHAVSFSQLPRLTDNAGEIASADKGTVPGAALALLPE